MQSSFIFYSKKPNDGQVILSMGAVGEVILEFCPKIHGLNILHGYLWYILWYIYEKGGQIGLYKDPQIIFTKFSLEKIKELW